MEITSENLNDINIRKLTLNKDFGKLKFERSQPHLIELQNLYKELDELDYQNNITQPEATGINGQKQELINLLKQIDQFDIAVVNSQQIHDDIENSIENHYNNAIPQLRSILVYLEHRAALKSKDKAGLQKQQKAAVQAEKIYKELSVKLQNEFKRLRRRKKVVEEAHGEIAAIYFGKHFENEAINSSKSADRWLRRRDKLFKWLLGIIIGNFIIYFCLFVVNKLGWSGFSPEEFFTPQYGIVKLALLAILSYAIGFASRNYSINSNLEATNKHRKNVAETLTDFLSTNPDEKARSQMIKQGTEAIFKHLPTGYVPKSEQKSEGPIYKIINTILKSNKE